MRGHRLAVQVERLLSSSAALCLAPTDHLDSEISCCGYSLNTFRSSHEQRVHDLSSILRMTDVFEGAGRISSRNLRERLRAARTLPCVVGHIACCSISGFARK